MKVPTTGTEVFSQFTSSSTTNGQVITTNFPVDLALIKQRSLSAGWYWYDRLRGNAPLLNSTNSDEELSAAFVSFANNAGLITATNFGSSPVFYNFSRRPGFFDVVCYTGTGSATTVAHNLTVVPELMIVKKRSATDDWAVYAGDNTDFLLLNTTAATADDNTYWNDTTPTSTVFSVGTNADVNTSAATYVAYLFATLAGVSKVGSYTGNGSTQAIACGFAGGARFVLIKRTDSTGDWYVYDTARGMTLLTDPYLELNTSDAEVATLGSVTTTTGGFTVDATILAAINTNAASYIFLAIS
jgi:hypothetical protein